MTPEDFEFLSAWNKIRIKFSTIFSHLWGIIRELVT